MRVKSIALVDIETSGMNATIDEIIYAHATIMPASGRITAFSEYAKPKIPLMNSVERLTGITNAKLENMRPSSIVKAEFLDTVKDAIIIGNNKAYLEEFFGVKIANFIDAREMMKIELVSNHKEELKALLDKLNDVQISTAQVQKELEVSYAEANIIREVLNAMRGER